MHAVLHGVDRDQLMAKHKANHVQVAYSPDADTANRAATVKAALFDALGIEVHLCGSINLIGASDDAPPRRAARSRDALDQPGDADVIERVAPADGATRHGEADRRGA